MRTTEGIDIAGRQGEGAVLHQRDGRQGGLFQALGWRAFATRLHLEALGGAKDMLRGEVFPIWGKLVAQLGGIGGLAEEAENRDERQQAAIQRHFLRCGTTLGQRHGSLPRSQKSHSSGRRPLTLHAYLESNFRTRGVHARAYVVVHSPY